MAPQRKTATQQQRQAGANDSSAAGPAARTRAAARQQQQQEQHAAEMVLPLLLQHDSVRTRLPLVCSLLCCSKAVAAAVAEHCAGQLELPRRSTAVAGAEAQQQLAAWLRKHARLVRSLDLQYGSESAPAVPALMAAGPQTLALQSLKVNGNLTTLPLLEQLPAHSLTHLSTDLHEQSEAMQPQHRPALVARLSAALGRLTGLQALALFRPADGSLELPCLSGLTRLTSLRHKGPASDLQHAPPQLLELELERWQWEQQQPLELSRLTALTRVKCVGLSEGDVLPSNVLSLRVGNCRSWQPLLGLQRLQQLEARFDTGAEADADITADQLRQLSRLSALSLGYISSVGIEPASAAAWPLLPLQRLQLEMVSLSAAVCQRLAQLSGLTSLRLDGCSLQQPGSAQHLAAALRQLSGLQQLKLSHPAPVAADNTTTETSRGMQQLLQAVGSLQRLRELNVSQFPQLAAAAAGPGNSLAALTGLTALAMAFCRLTDAAAASIVSQLPGLQSLDCSGINLSVTDAGLPAIGRLQRLIDLSICYCSCVTDAGLLHLTGLVRLRKLNVGGTSITDAGLHHLTGLTQLQELVVPDCVSVHQRRLLEQQLPDRLF